MSKVQHSTARGLHWGVAPDFLSAAAHNLMAGCADAFSRSKMFGRKEKRHSLYYLLPGMTRANRQKRRRVFWWSIIVGLLAAALVGGIIWLANRGPQP
jgi:hypothetical protein